MAEQVPTPSINPMAQSHEALKAMTDAANPSAAQAIADGWAELADGFDEAVSLFQQAMLGSEGGWTGEAADGMRASLARVARWSKDMGASYRAASTAITAQTAAASHAKSTMPQPVPYDPAQLIRDATAGGSAVELAMLPFRMYEQKARHDAAHAEAARVVSRRDTSFVQSATDIPEFTPPPVLTSGGPAAVAGSAPGGPAVGGGGPPARPSAPRIPSPAPPAPGTTASAAPSASDASVPPPAGGWFGSAGAPAAPSAPVPSNAANVSLTTASVAPAAPFGPVAPPAPIPTGPSAVGFGGTSASGAAGFGPTGFGPTGGIPPAAGLPVTGRTAGVPMAGASVPTEKDAERKRPEYLIEPDAEGMFGFDGMTAPPVIGEG